jgi:hypothetical protein
MSSITPQELIAFEDRVKDAYENTQVKGPVHLSKNNEEQLIELFQYIHKDDWVLLSLEKPLPCFTSWS